MFHLFYTSLRSWLCLDGSHDGLELCNESLTDTLTKVRCGEDSVVLCLKCFKIMSLNKFETSSGVCLKSRKRVLGSRVGIKMQFKMTLSHLTMHFEDFERK